MDAAFWDERYRAAELIWGAQPNRFVEAELGSLTGGTALDLACGEGRNAIWLASRGWQVTAVDFSALGIDKARELEASLGSGAPVTWIVADVLTYRPSQQFDLVLLAYLQLPAAQRRQVVRSAVGALAQNGILLVVAHDLSNIAHGTGGPQDLAVLYTAEDLRADIGASAELVIDTAGVVTREVAGAQRPARDVLLRAHRALQAAVHPLAEG
jgi:SAM-dependent methyltransferase